MEFFQSNIYKTNRKFHIFFHFVAEGCLKEIEQPKLSNFQFAIFFIGT